MNRLIAHIVCGISLVTSCAVGSPADAQWDYRFAIPGIRDGLVAAMKFDGSNIFVGGQFQTVGRTRANGLAKFDGLQWHGFTNGPEQDVILPNVNALEFFQGNLCVGGSFTNAGGLATGGLAFWNKTNWFVPNITNGVVNALLVAPHGLLVGGRFFIPGVTNPVALARWDGQAWTVLNSELPPCGESIICLDSLQQMKLVGTDVFAILGFHLPSDPSAQSGNLLVRCDENAEWSNFAGPDGGSDGFDNYSLADYNGSLIVAGNFINPTNSAIRNIALWDGAAWQAMDSGLPGEVYNLAGNDQSLYAFYRSNGTNVPALFRIARWDGGTWSDLDTNDIDGNPGGTLFIGPDDEIYLSGLYRRIGERGFVGLACWKNGEWRTLFEGSYEGICGAGQSIFTFHKHAGSVYAGGNFLGANNRLTQNLARWDGVKWNPVGGGMGGISSAVLAISSADSDLIVGGTFTNVGGVPVSNIARWDKTNWTALGAGFDDRVNALVNGNGTLFAGGRFVASGTNSVYHVARWDGAIWQPLGTGCDDDVTKLAFWNNELYAAGAFTMAGGSFVPGIAKWNGENWSRVGTEDWTPINPRIKWIAAGEDGVYVVGQFTKAAGVSAKNVARWDGQNWHSVGSGVDGNLVALAVYGKTVFVGGEMTNNAGVKFGGIYRFDGTNWYSLGTGVSDPRGTAPIRALYATDNGVFVSGIFSFAGTRPSANVARWIEKPNLKLGIIPNSADGKAILQATSDPGLCFKLEHTVDFRSWQDIWEGGGGERLQEIETSDSFRFFRASADSEINPDGSVDPGL